MPDTTKHQPLPHAALRKRDDWLFTNGLVYCLCLTAVRESKYRCANESCYDFSGPKQYSLRSVIFRIVEEQKLHGGTFQYKHNSLRYTVGYSLRGNTAIYLLST